MKKGTLVKITCQDIVTELSGEKPPCTIEAVSIGRLECQKGKTYRLCSCWYTNEKDWPSKDWIAIPKGCVDKIEVLA